MTKNDEAFIKHVKSECRKYGVKYEMHNAGYLRLPGNMKCSGYFDDTTPILVVAKKRQDFLEILTHEFCHLTQWVEQCDVWVNLGNSTSIVDSWLMGKDCENINYHLDRCRDLELDNEKRSVKMMEKFKLSIDSKLYTKKSNAYVLLYNWMKISRRWPKGAGGAPNTRLLDAMPDTFSLNYTKLSKEIETIFREENI